MRNPFRHPVITRRDDAALPHEDVPHLLAGDAVQQWEDDGQDGNSTPNGGR